MTKNIKYGVGALALFWAVSACQQDAFLMQEGEGQLLLGVQLNADLVVTKSAFTPDSLAEKASIRIYNNKGLIRKYEGVASVPQLIPLKSNHYSATIVAGDSVPASFDQVYYKGNASFEIVKGTVAEVELKAKVVNSVVQLSADSLDAVFSDYHIHVFAGKDTLTYTAANLSQKGFFMLPNPETDLYWIFEGVHGTDHIYTQEGVIEDPKPAYLYEMNFKFSESSTPTGGAFFDVEVDESEYLVHDHVVVPLRPQVKAEGFNIEESQLLEVGQAKPFTFSIKSFSAMQELALHSASLPEMGHTSECLALYPLDQALQDSLQVMGVTVIQTVDTVKGLDVLTVTMTEEFVLRFTKHTSSHNFEFFAKNSSDMERRESVSFTVSGDNFMTLPVKPLSLWATRATLQGRIFNTEAVTYGFRYAPKGTADWVEVEASTVTDEGFSVDLEGLKPASMYCYQATTSGDSTSVISAVIEEFTTDMASQLPNSSFEFWSKPDKAWLVYGEGQEMFWDTGNHGSATMSKNVTTYDETLFHSGTRSVKLQSQFVGISIIGKFAAGNIFAGKYLKTDGTSGVLSFGREFTSRPKRVKAYYKYRNGNVDYAEGAASFAKGKPDTMAFYVALGDWTPEKFEGYNAPVLIKNNPNNLQLFDPKGPNVIAYGKMERGTPTEGDGMHELVFDLEYSTYERKPTHIIVVGSASKYGDYFTGSTSSTLWLDDIELIYE